MTITEASAVSTLLRELDGGDRRAYPEQVAEAATYLQVRVQKALHVSPAVDPLNVIASALHLRGEQP